MIYKIIFISLSVIIFTCLILIEVKKRRIARQKRYTKRVKEWELHQAEWAKRFEDFNLWVKNEGLETKFKQFSKMSECFNYVPSDMVFVHVYTGIKFRALYLKDDKIIFNVIKVKKDFYNSQVERCSITLNCFFPLDFESVNNSLLLNLI